MSNQNLLFFFLNNHVVYSFNFNGKILVLIIVLKNRQIQNQFKVFDFQLWISFLSF